MKIFYALIVLLMGLSINAMSQNHYWRCPAQYIPHPLHCVPIMHSNGFVYYCQSMNDMLSVAELNPNSFSPTQDFTCELCDPQVNLCYSFQLRGGFENAGGDLVLYGYDDVELCAAVCVVRVSTQVARYVLLQSPNISTGPLVEGCDGFDTNGNEVYLFVDGNGPIISMNPSLSPGNAGLIRPIPVYPFPAGKYTDISWDTIHQCFIASGTNYHATVCSSNPFLDIFRVDISFPSLQRIPLTTYALDNGFFIDVSEAKAKHSILDNQHLILYHDLRDTCHDIIWLTLIKNYWLGNYAVIKSKAFLIPIHKMDVVDLLYDNYNRRLNFLGRLEYCGFNYFLAQIDPFLLSNMVGRQLTGVPTVSTVVSECSSQVLYLNNLSMDKMALDSIHPCHPILVGGVDDITLSFLLETYDVSNSTCDMKLNFLEKDCYPINSDIIQVSIDMVGEIPHYTQSYFNGFATYKYCGIPDNCSPSKRTTDSLNYSQESNE